MPDISVLYPLRNARSYPNFERGLQSTLDQENVGVEIVIGVDPSSTDDTWVRVSRWAERDERIKPFLRDPRFIFGDTLDACAEHATGKYFIIQTARCWYGQGTFANFRNFLQAESLFGFVYGQFNLINERRWLHMQNFNRTMAYLRFISLFGYMYRSEAWHKHGLRYGDAEYADDGSWIGIGDRDFQMQMLVRLSWDGWYASAGEMHYDGPGELTRKLQSNRATADKFWRDRWGKYFGDMD